MLRSAPYAVYYSRMATRTSWQFSLCYSRSNFNRSYVSHLLSEARCTWCVPLTLALVHVLVLCAGSPFKLDAQLGPDPSKCAMGGPALQANAILQVGLAAATASSTVPLPLLLFHGHCPLGDVG